MASIQIAWPLWSQSNYCLPYYDNADNSSSVPVVRLPQKTTKEPVPPPYQMPLLDFMDVVIDPVEVLPPVE